MTVQCSTTHNFAVLASLVDLLRHINDRCALVGRVDGAIVIDATRTPAWILEELHGSFLASYLASENGRLPVFCGLVEDEASQTVLLDAQPVLSQGLDAMKQYPGLLSIRRLLDGIPQIPHDLAAHFQSTFEHLSNNTA